MRHLFASRASRASRASLRSSRSSVIDFFDQDHGNPVLRFADEDGDARWVPAELLAQQIQASLRSFLRLIVLEACTPQTCDAGGRWQDQTACETECKAGSCSGPSCNGLPSTCGPRWNESCCLSPVVLGGTYNRKNEEDYPTTVSNFRLDRLEITVARFRKFVEAYPASRPAAGAGAHPRIPGSGWPSEWDAQLPADRETLESLFDHEYSTWRDQDRLPMNYLSWHHAFAFCAWDGGRLPTEAEWNYASAGGFEQREYPWSTPPSSTLFDRHHAVYNCSSRGIDWMCGKWDIQPVGQKSPLGDGKWGQADLAGSMWEWNLDTFSDRFADASCDDCANIDPGLDRVLRGGSWNTNGSPCSPPHASTPLRRIVASIAARTWAPGARGRRDRRDVIPRAPI
ncbi:formylglycine-generating enzyme family protein [Sorangium sp. So ce887]|uniref:formylglycine-generating enzyme family protein n=1 Tax=Sorangium sp. So ce887 TaxID=3133324 RepID=UPI003F617D9E